MQSRFASILETMTSTAIGFIVALLTTALVLPALGFPISDSQNVEITAIFTAISMLRSYVVRRAFNALHARGGG